jgi:hypothetical protein
MAFYQVSVEFRTTDIDSGKIKKQKVQYLVDSESVTESEARMVQHLTTDGINDFEVVSSSQSKIVEVVYPPQKD